MSNSLDPDQDRRSVRTVLDPNYLSVLNVFLKEFFEKVNFEKKSADDNKGIKNHPACKELTLYRIETPFNSFAKRVDPDQAALVRAA